MYSLQQEPEKAGRWIVLLGAGLLSVGVQAGVILGATKITPPKRPPPPPRTQMALVNIERPKPVEPVQKPVEKPVEKPKPVEKAKVEAKKPKPKPKVRKKRKARKKRLKKRAKKRIVKKAPAKSTPAKAEQAKPAKRKPRLIAGLNLGSTVKGGSGPRFGTGNTVMGDPGDVAEAPIKRDRPSGRPDGKVDGQGSEPETPPPIRRAAKLKKKTLPNYPAAARRDGIEGVVIVLLTIDSSGRVKAAKLIKGIGHGLDEAALAAAKKTIWSPATVDGAPTKSMRRFNVRFTLES